MDGFDSDNAYWVWFILGLVLAALEMVVPGVYLIWLAVAAIITGVLAFVADPPVAIQVVSFVSLSLIAAFSARRWLRDKPITSADPMLNNRAGQLVGETAVVSTAIEGGSGRVHIGDSDWIARGPDAAVGDRVRITGSDGVRLLVEPVALIADDSGESDEPEG